MFPKYPYLDLSDRNLDFLTKAIREMENEVKNFVSLNAVKYANPIQWSINRQYEKNTIVIDPLTGTAFISVQPVPNGVSLTRTQYWTPVFDLSQFVTKAASNFANSYERDITTTATVSTGAGDWIVWDSTLYVALTSIHAGDAYVVNGNIKRMTVEDFYNLLMEAIRALDGRIDDEIRDRQDADTALGGRIDDEIRDRQDADTALGGRIDDEIRDRQDADTALGGRIDDVIRDIGDLTDLTTVDKSSIVNAINEIEEYITSLSTIYYNVEEYGAVGDGVTDDTDAINTAITAATNAGGGVVYLPHKTAYKTSQPLILSGNVFIKGEGMTVINSTASDAFRCYGWYGGIEDVHIDGNGSNNGIALDSNKINAQIPYKWRFKHIEVYNTTHAFYQIADSDSTHYVVDIWCEDFYCNNNHGDSIWFPRSRGFMTFRNVKVDNTYNAGYTPYVGFNFEDVIGLELEFCDVVASGRTNLTPTYLNNQVAYRIIGSGDGKASVWLKRVVFDSGWGNGFLISNIYLLQMLECEAFATWGYCFYFDGCTWGNICDSIISGAKLAPDSPDDSHGIVLNSCGYINIVNTLMRDIKGIALNLYNSDRINISNVCVNNAKTGVYGYGTTVSLINGITLDDCTIDFDNVAGIQIKNTFVNGVYA